ncbi:site-specific integrase [Anaerobacillus arseniciselenatis]|uniref:Site-specific integrase n=1 Tax=Anaerobacillus arseniciselenatis TaxID=85682 RepID=A0A1S2LTN6_9BACI|nr:tyrosine-type recombinase/integrase [Anaerobacillus arseniciselenatis]OIJ15726.1 site-specific integrase [Anaerobacillus arseniciselenatis]
MEFVEAIKDRQKIREIKEILFKRSKRDYLLFTLGINTGLKISEILNIKKGELVEDDIIREFLVIEGTEETKIFLNEQVKEAIDIYIPTVPSLSSDNYLFKSKKGDLPITRQQAYRIINSVAREVGIDSKIGTHTLRKTFGYHAYRGGVAISLLQKIFHHSSRGETMKYIGISKDEETYPKIDVNL